MVLIEDIERAYATIEQHLRRTPVEYSPWIQAQTQADVWLKLENTQVTGSFKVRGALNAVLALSASHEATGVVAASTGNHGAGVAHAARIAGMPARIFVPENIPDEKLAGIRDAGAQIIRTGDDCVESEGAARAHAAEVGFSFVSPYNDAQVVAGQGTLGLEIATQLEECDAIYVAMGGGGLISGIGTYLKSRWPNCQIVACSPENSCVMHQSLEAGRILDLPSLPTLSDSTAGGVEAGSITFAMCSQVVDRSLLVTESEIASALRSTVSRHHTLIEGAAAAAVAACLKDAEWLRGKRACVLLCGANIPAGKLGQLL